MSDKKKLPEFVEEIKATGNWTVPAGCTSIDAFAVGGGSGSCNTGGGGGGGYTNTVYNIAVTPGELLAMTIGAGGAIFADGNPSSIKRSNTALVNAGGGLCTKNGVAGGTSGRDGGDGGCGGGGGSAHAQGGAGGSDGGSGAGGMVSSTPSYGGSGQGSTTRCPFNNILYGGGGGGMSEGYAGADGGAGGGGQGSRFSNTIASPGTPNTGGGAGGGWTNAQNAGGSGIIIIHYTLL